MIEMINGIFQNLMEFYRKQKNLNAMKFFGSILELLELAVDINNNHPSQRSVKVTPCNPLMQLQHS